MGTTDVALKRIFLQLIRGNAGLAITELETYLAAWPNPQTAERLRVIKEEYSLLADYWQLGVEDPQRGEQYQRLLQRLYVLSGNISIFRHLNSSSYLHGLYTSARQQGGRLSLDAVRRDMEDFVSNMAMLELEPAANQAEILYQQHQQQLNRLFNFLMTSNIWPDGVAKQIEDLLLTPTIDSMDQQLMVSAITLSLMNRFDMAKFRVLVNIYSHSLDEAVRQRALVGWVLSIDDDFLTVYPEEKELIAQLLKKKKVCDELTELQIQLIYTLDAERDTQTMTQEIMPELMKNNNLQMTDKGLVEREEDHLEEVLHPEISEQRMEQLEATIQRMQNMQQQGSDLFFAGFSQMKRYPFFYDISNWLMPFYMQHPDLHQYVERLGENAFVDKIIGQVPFCNSDKYSFVIAFQEVMNQLPDSMKQLIKRGEASFMGTEVDEELLQSTAFIRRSYLMDLYRFFRLFPNRSALCNPFDTSRHETGMCLFFGSQLFSDTPLEERKREIVSMLLKRKLKTTAQELLDTFPEEMRDVQYYLWKESYGNVLKLDPENEQAQVHLARLFFSQKKYDLAYERYEKLQMQHPEKSIYKLNLAVCLTHLEEYEDALKTLYQLNYEQPDNIQVTRALAWTLLCDDRLEQAGHQYEQLTADERANSEDFLNRGYCLWLQGKIRESVNSFKKSMELSGTSVDDFWLTEKELLTKHNISNMEINMMEAFVKG